MLRVNNLVGFGATTPRLSIASASIITASSGQFTLPADIKNGDIIAMVHCRFFAGSGSGTSAYGTGFSSINAASNGNASGSFRVCASRKVADGTEGGTTVGGFMTGGTIVWGVPIILRPFKFAPVYSSGAGNGDYQAGAAAASHGPSKTEKWGLQVMLAHGTGGSTNMLNGTIVPADFTHSGHVESGGANGSYCFAAKVRRHPGGVASSSFTTPDSGARNMARCVSAWFN